MDSVRPFIPRRRPRLAKVIVQVTVTNDRDPTRRKRFSDVYGPVWIQIEGFRRIVDEVIFLEMEEGPRGYQPLVGYTVLEKSGAAVDMVSHQLIAHRSYDLKSAAVA